MTTLERVALALAEHGDRSLVRKWASCEQGSPARVRPGMTPIDVIAAMERRGWCFYREEDGDDLGFTRGLRSYSEKVNWQDANSISEAIYKASLRALASEKK